MVDDWQRHGLGTELLTQLRDRARQEGIRRFTALAASDNVAVLALLQRLGDDVHVTSRESGTVEYEITLAPKGLGEELHALLRALGRQQLKAAQPIRDTLAVLVPKRFTPAGE